MDDVRLARIRGMRGCNWFPSWSATPASHWTGASARPEAVDRELGLAEAMGFDAVRIWLSAAGDQLDPPAYLVDLRYVLDACGARGLGVVVELFDSCGIEASTGRPRKVRVEDVPALAAGDERITGLLAWAADGDVFDGPGLVEVPWCGDPYAAVWEGWEPNPGYDLLGEQHFPRWDAYLADVVDVLGDHKAVLFVGLMNEPFITHLGVAIDRAPISHFLAHVHDLVRELAPQIPLSVASATLDELGEHERALGGDLDVVSIHSYSDGAGLAAAIAGAREIAGDRPVCLSEWGHFPGGDDAAQLDAFDERLPVVAAAGVGWIVSHLVIGYGPFANAGLLYPSGVMRPAARRLRRHLRGPPRY